MKILSLLQLTPSDLSVGFPPEGKRRCPHPDHEILILQTRHQEPPGIHPGILPWTWTDVPEFFPIRRPGQVPPIPVHIRFQDPIHRTGVPRIGDDAEFRESVREEGLRDQTTRIQSEAFQFRVIGGCGLVTGVVSVLHQGCTGFRIRFPTTILLRTPELSCVTALHIDSVILIHLRQSVVDMERCSSSNSLRDPDPDLTLRIPRRAVMVIPEPEVLNPGMESEEDTPEHETQEGCPETALQDASRSETWTPDLQALLLELGIMGRGRHPRQCRQLPLPTQFPDPLEIEMTHTPIREEEQTHSDPDRDVGCRGTEIWWILESLLLLGRLFIIIIIIFIRAYRILRRTAVPTVVSAAHSAGVTGFET